MKNIFTALQSDLQMKWCDPTDIQKRISLSNSIIPGLNGQETVDADNIDQKLYIPIKKLPTFLAGIAVLLMSTATFASHDGIRQFYGRGVAATGVNDLCGEPLFTLPAPEGSSPTVHAPQVGEYDPEGELPIPLSPGNCNDDIVLATYTDLDFLARIGAPDVDARLKNIPLREVPVISKPDGSRSVLPSLDSVPGNALPNTKSNPNDPITLGKWLKAGGRMHLRCEADGTAKMELKFKNLIPNGVYSVWGIWNTTLPGAARARIVPLPLGGIPNVVIPDKKGRATFYRELASCPKDVTADGSILLFIDMAYHSDSNVSGTFPQIGGTPTKFKMNGVEFSSSLVPGAVAHDHVLFLISGDQL